jgi:hypothetical protein
MYKILYFLLALVSLVVGIYYKKPATSMDVSFWACLILYWVIATSEKKRE